MKSFLELIIFNKKNSITTKKDKKEEENILQIYLENKRKLKEQEAVLFQYEKTVEECDKHLKFVMKEVQNQLLLGKKICEKYVFEIPQVSDAMTAVITEKEKRKITREKILQKQFENFRLLLQTGNKDVFKLNLINI